MMKIIRAMIEILKGLRSVTATTIMLPLAQAVALGTTFRSSVI